MSTDTTPKRKPGRPRKDSRGTQKELQREARTQRVMNEEGEKARRAQARRDVQRIVREVFGDSPYFSKLVAALFMDSAHRVAGASLDIEPRELGEFVSTEFVKVLAECASFDGLSRTAQMAGPMSVPRMVAVAATPDLAGFAAATLGDMDDEFGADLPPLSDEDAQTMGFLPDA